MDSERTDTTAPVAGAVALLAALVERRRAELHDHIAALVADGSNRDLIDAAQVVEQVVRSAEQAAITITKAVERRGLYLDDGHRDVKAWWRAAVHLSPFDAARRWRLARVERSCPQVASALTTGTVGVAQANKLAVVWSNPRVRHDLEDTIDSWLTVAHELPYVEFEQKLDEWACLVDQDGGHRDRDSTHARRDVRFLTVGEEVLIRGNLLGVHGEGLRVIFDAFVDAEYRQDVDEAEARLGVDHVTGSDLERTPGQRRADALTKLFDAAATADLDGQPVKVTVDIVVDQATFERQLLDLFDPLHQHRTGPEAHGFDGDDLPPLPDAPSPRSRVCRTVRGTLVDPADAVIAALTGHVRRVVVGADGVVIDLGRRGRLYAGSSREAAYLQAAISGQHRCLWPGCDRAPRQLDHIIAYAESGKTTPANAGPMCAHHNLFKNRGYTTRRDPSGRWHTYRPDSTEITAR